MAIPMKAGNLKKTMQINHGGLVWEPLYILSTRCFVWMKAKCGTLTKTFYFRADAEVWVLVRGA